MKLTRRNVLKLAAGSAVGIMFTPLPWKGLDDSAIWTQNWPWIPVPTTGEITFKTTACALCTAGCGVRARCVNNIPVQLMGIPGHASHADSLCPVGLAGHHLPFHPSRIPHPLRRIHSRSAIESSPVSKEEAFSAIARAIAEQRSSGAIAVLDMRAGRAISDVYRQWLQTIGGGILIAPPATEFGILAAMQRMTHPHAEFGLDLEQAGTIVSFGTPLFEGWGNHGRMAKIALRKSETGHPFIIHFDSRLTPTAAAADLWIPARPGTEGIAALGLANLLLSDGLFKKGTKPCDAFTESFIALAKSWDPERVAKATGVTVDALHEVVKNMTSSAPAVVLAGGNPAAGPLSSEEEACFVGLNALVGSINSPGGIVARHRLPQVSTEETPLVKELDLLRVPDRSVSVLILDGAENGSTIPWHVIERKLTGTSAMVVSLSPMLCGIARYASIILPEPAPYEHIEELTTSPDSPLATFALSGPLFTPPPTALEPIDSLRGIAASLGVSWTPPSLADMLKKRAEAIIASRRGTVHGEGAQTPVTAMTSADQMMELLTAGGIWIDEPATRSDTARISQCVPDDETVIRIRTAMDLRANPSPHEIVAVPFGWKNATATGLLSPVLSKLYQESTLRPFDGQAFVHPSTLKESGLQHGSEAILATGEGTMTIVLHEDASLMPGVVAVPVGPDPEAINNRSASRENILALCGNQDSTWRATPATLRRA